MAIDGGSNNCFPSNTYVTGMTAGPPSSLGQITIAQHDVLRACNSTADQLSISGAHQLVLGNTTGATGTEPQANLYIGVGYYRMIGAVFTTNSTSPVIVPFTQDGDTFYLNAPVADVSGVSLTNTPTTLTLASVPNGIQVKAFGRCVGGSGTTITTRHVIVYSPDQAAAPAPQAFPASPGYGVSSLTSSTAFPFSAWTNTSASLNAVSDYTGTPPMATIDCVTDGWVWHRGQCKSAAACPGNAR